MNLTMDQITEYLRERSGLINDRITSFIPKEGVPSILKESMEYSLLAGGKRIRPILSMAVYEAFGKDHLDVFSIAVNIELLHTYSLIHDDLPAMDNDDYRRGKLTNHKVYGEAMAILAGDALLTHAFGNMAKSLIGFPNLHIDRALQIIDEFAFYSGATGMVGGQAEDLKEEVGVTSFEDLIYIHTHKTGALIVFSIRLGAILAGADDRQLRILTEFAQKIGLAFQIQDDILDVIGDTEKMGKKAGSDQENHKVTYPFFKGLEESKEEVKRLILQAKDAIKDIGIDPTYLHGIADFFVSREI